MLPPDSGTETSRQRWARVYASFPPFLALASGLFITAMVFFWVHHVEKEFGLQYHLASLLVLLAGVAISTLAAVYVHTLATNSRRVQQLVDKRTAELAAANRRLVEDIAAREQAEKALRHTQHILTSAQKIAHLGSWEFDAKTGAMQVSDEYLRICGIDRLPDKPTTKYFLGMIHPDDQEHSKMLIRAIGKGEQWFRDERRIVRPDGAIRYVVSQAEVLYNERREYQGLIGSFLDITEHKDTELALRQTQEKLRELAAHQERIKEDERQRIAREVHDELGSVLTGIKAYLSVAIERATRAGAAPDQLLNDASNLVDVATDTVRRVITDLRPSVLDQLGVWAALEWYAGQIEKRSGIGCECVISEATAATDIGPERGIVLFRIVQEALTNVVRHAQARHVTIHATRRDNAILVEVEDDGRGIDNVPVSGRESWGIIGMQERARHVGAEFRIAGTPGTGTIVTLKLPIDDSNER